MASPASGRSSTRTSPGPHFHRLRVGRVVAETADARSFVLEVPGELDEAFAYRAGQFCTFRIEVGDRPLLRCYSMSSSPEVDGELQVTVKRVPGGAVSNWMIDNLGPGDTVEVTPPAGVFSLSGGTGDVVAFAGGSGITPVFSIVKTALATTTRHVRVLYANREPGSVIFREGLERLAASHRQRLEVVHHLDAHRGLVTIEEVTDFAGGAPGAEYFLCGPQPFMDLVAGALDGRGVAPGEVHLERFDPLATVESETVQSETVPDGATPGVEVTIRLDGSTKVATHRPGTTILQTARQVGFSPPYSCEAGNCATCMAKLVEGRATMRANNALTEEEVAEGWILTCQAVPVSTVEVAYGYGD